MNSVRDDLLVGLRALRPDIAVVTLDGGHDLVAERSAEVAEVILNAVEGAHIALSCYFCGSPTRW